MLGAEPSIMTLLELCSNVVKGIRQENSLSIRLKGHEMEKMCCEQKLIFCSQTFIYFFIFLVINLVVYLFVIFGLKCLELIAEYGVRFKILIHEL